MIASLMMYKRPELNPALARFWTLIKEHLEAEGIACPKQLSQDEDEFTLWQHPSLVLSQTCGMPYRTNLHHSVNLVATPNYALEQCPAGYYRSAIVVRKQDSRTAIAQFKDALFAYNQTFSQSGFAAPYWHLKPHGFWFQRRLVAGGHMDSAKAVAEGRADIAAIDAVTWMFIEQYDAFAADLKVLEWTQPTPSLPYICASSVNPEKVRAAVQQAILSLHSTDASVLRIHGLVDIPKSTYLQYQNPPAEVAAG